MAIDIQQSSVSSSSATTAAAITGHDLSLHLPYELLLLSQALVQHGASDFNKISSLICAHPAVKSALLGNNNDAPSRYKPEALSLSYTNAIKLHSITPSNNATTADADVTKPNARPHLKLARLFYMERLKELRTKLSSQEDRIKLLLKEQQAIESGTQDEILTTDYNLLKKHPEILEESIYSHKFAAANLHDQIGSKHLAADGSNSVLDKTLAGERSSIDSQQLPDSAELVPKIEDEIHDLRPTDELTTSSREPSLQTSNNIASNDSIKHHQNNTHNPTERRSSGRNSRPAETVPPFDATVNIPGRTYPHLMPSRDSKRTGGNFDDEEGQSKSPKRQAPQLENVDNVPTPQYRSEQSSSSTKVPIQQTYTRDPSEMSHAEGGRSSSPMPSDRSRSKRIKTEEPDSALGTPDPDRTPLGSDLSIARRFKNSAPHLISQMQGSVYSTYFKDPVRPGEALNYFEIIKRPMDLKTLSQNVRNGKVTTSTEFTRDLTLIFANAIMYNGAEHHVGRDALAMWREAQGLLRVLEAAEQRII